MNAIRNILNSKIQFVNRPARFFKRGRPPPKTPDATKKSHPSSPFIYIYERLNSLHPSSIARSIFFSKISYLEYSGIFK